MVNYLCFQRVKRERLEYSRALKIVKLGTYGRSGKLSARFRVQTFSLPFRTKTSWSLDSELVSHEQTKGSLTFLPGSLVTSAFASQPLRLRRLSALVVPLQLGSLLLLNRSAVRIRRRFIRGWLPPLQRRTSRRSFFSSRQSADTAGSSV